MVSILPYFRQKAFSLIKVTLEQIKCSNMPHSLKITKTKLYQYM